MLALLPGEREAGLSGQTPRQLAIGNAGGFPHVGCAAINNRSRNDNSVCFSLRTHHPSGQEGPPRTGAARPSKAREASNGCATSCAAIILAPLACRNMAGIAIGVE